MTENDNSDESYRLLRFRGLSRPVALIDVPELVEALPTYFRGWDIEDAAPEDADPPVLTLDRTAKAYRVAAPWLDQPYLRPDPVDTMCGFVAEFVRAYVTQDDRLLCLHCAAAEFGGRLVVFPSRYRAGKSVLSACLAAAGYRLFGDDVLPISDEGDLGMAAGLSPRLRLPLPDDLSAGAQSFIAGNHGTAGKRYLYLDLPPERLAERGTTAPIGAFVLLERDPEATPEFAPIREAEILREVIWQNFAREGGAPDILLRLRNLVEKTQRYRLRYRRAEEAVELLAEKFSLWPETPESATDGAVSPTPETAPPEASYRILTAEAAREGCYLRKPGISETEVDGERFLADAQGAAIHHLNPVASALWHVLATPMTAGQIVDLLHSAFPEVARERIEDDIGKLIADFSAKGLLISLPATEPGG